MSRTWKIVIAVVAVVVLAGVAGFFFMQSQGRGPQVDTATVEKVDLSVSVTASGKVEAGRRADVYPPTAGTLAAVYVREGQKVKAGQKLAMMDTEPLQLQVAQAQAGVAQAKAQLETIDNNSPSSADQAAADAGVAAAQDAYDAARKQLAAVDSNAPSAEQLKAADTAVRAATTSYNNAVAAHKAAQKAYDASPTPANAALVSQTETAEAQAKAGLDSAKASKAALQRTDLSAAQAQAEAGVAQAKGALASAKAQADKLDRTSTSAQEAAAQAALDQANDGLAVANANLAAATMEAPINGTVFFNPLGQLQSDGKILQAAPGVGVAPQAPPFTVVNLQGSTFVAEVDEADIARVKPGMAAVLRFDAYPTDDVKSKVLQLQPSARQTATGGTVFPVDLGLAGSGLNLLIGMKGDAEIKVKAVPTALVIPIEALFDENGQTFVYVVDNGTTLKKTDIKVGATTETQVQVVEGLQEGDVVALSGSTDYTDGMTVRVKQ